MLELPVIPTSEQENTLKEAKEIIQEKDPSFTNVLEYFKSIKNFKNMEQKQNIQPPKFIMKDRKLMINNKKPTGEIYKRGTTHSKKLLPKVNRLNPTADFPEITEEDERNGVFDLVNRGFISSSTSENIIKKDSMLRTTPLKLYEKKELPIKSIPYSDPKSFNTASLKLDVTTPVFINPNNIPEIKRENIHPYNKNITLETKTNDPEYNEKRSLQPRPPSISRNILESKIDGESMQEKISTIRRYNELLDTYSLHQFIIRHGKALRETPEFISFERTNQQIWGAIESIITHLENFCLLHNLPLVYIDGQQVVQLSLHNLGALSNNDILSCVLNADQVTTLLARKGHKFKIKDFNNLERQNTVASLKIQATYRMHIERKRYIRLHDVNGAVKRIQRVWRLHICHTRMKARLLSRRQEEEVKWNNIMSQFKERWDYIKCQRRIVIHIPSLSLEESSRMKLENFSTLQNLQMARLCAIADPLVDVIYISPFELNIDVKSYYMNLLQLGNGGRKGDIDIGTRIRILHPENSDRFPSHFSLSTLLLLSPKCIKKIKRYVKSKEAYIVTGRPGQEDKRIAIKLELPILGPDPQVAVQAFGIKSASKKIFMKADVNIPNGAYDIYDLNDLVVCLSQLIVSTPHISRWLIKLDNDELSTGIAYIDVESLESLKIIAKEGKNTIVTDDQDVHVRNTLTAALEKELMIKINELIHFAYPEIFLSWEAFKKSIETYGAVIEAAPPNISGYIRSNMFIEPSGKTHITSTQEIITNAQNPFEFLGSIFPQYIIPHKALEGASLAIASRIYENGYFGYVSIDFVAFEPSNNKKVQRIWALDLLTYLTNSALCFVLFHYLVNGQYIASFGQYHLCKDTKEDPVFSDQSDFDPSKYSSVLLDTRCFIAQEYIYHPELFSSRYSAFFNSCQLNGVYFDLENLSGTMFILSDSLSSGVLGVICIGQSKKDAFRYLTNALGQISHAAGFNNTSSSTIMARKFGNFSSILLTTKQLTKKYLSSLKSSKNNRIKNIKS